jgi:hypothetical protein
MKKTKILIILMVGFMWTQAFAGLEAENILKQINNSMASGLVALNIDYKEFVDDPNFKSTEAGTMAGLFLNARIAPWEKLYADLYLDFLAGTLKYDGAYATPPYAPLVKDFAHIFFNTILKVGPLFNLGDRYSLQAIPYVGIGYRYWHRQSNNFYSEKYHHGKALVGIKLNCLLTDDFVLSPYVEVGKMFGAHMEYVATGVDHKLGNKPIYGAGLELNYKMADDLFLNGFVNYTQFKYGKSALATDGSYEPDSKTREIKLGIGVRYM